MLFIAVFILTVIIFGAVAITMPVWRRGPLERQRPDYERINRMEHELGIPLSDYRDKGVDVSEQIFADLDKRLAPGGQRTCYLGDAIVSSYKIQPIDDLYPMEIITPALARAAVRLPRLSRAQKVARLEAILDQEGSEPKRPYSDRLTGVLL